jgi:hypothetical protein
MRRTFPPLKRLFVMIVLAPWIMAAPAAPPLLSVQVSLARIPEQPDTYEAVAIVHAADGGAFLAAPFLRFERGVTAVTSSASETGGTVSFSIGPVIDRRRANWLVVWRRDGAVVGRERGVVFLRPDG